jgi:hypothetical protein
MASFLALRLHYLHPPPLSLPLSLSPPPQRNLALFTTTATSTITHTTRGTGPRTRLPSMAEVGWRSTTGPGGASRSCGEPGRARFLGKVRIWFLYKCQAATLGGGGAEEYNRPGLSTHTTRPQMGLWFESRRAPPCKSIILVLECVQFLRGESQVRTLHKPRARKSNPPASPVAEAPRRVRPPGSPRGPGTGLSTGQGAAGPWRWRTMESPVAEAPWGVFAAGLSTWPWDRALHSAGSRRSLAPWKSPRHGALWRAWSRRRRGESGRGGAVESPATGLSKWPRDRALHEARTGKPKSWRARVRDTCGEPAAGTVESPRPFAWRARGVHRGEPTTFSVESPHAGTVERVHNL